ncbi:MAG: hypothetical protein GX447_08100 [Elusimicrobia bacterium]|nr:hypothetical protein [Elusimicrobiota bacterium]
MKIIFAIFIFIFNLNLYSIETFTYKEISKDISKQIKESEKNNIKVAVFDFAYYDGKISPALRQISESLTINLAKNSITIVERNQIEKILQEKKLQMSGMFDEKTVTEVGTFVGAEAILTGTVEDMENGKSKINIKVLNVKTSVIIAAGEYIIDRTWELYKPKQEPEKKETKIYSEIKFEIEKLPKLESSSFHMEEIHLDFNNMDIDKLEKYNEITELEKKTTDYLLIAEKWDIFGKEVPEYREISIKRANELRDHYNKIIKFEEDKKKIREQMRADFEKLMRILKLKIISSDKKDEFCQKFIDAYSEYEFEEFSKYYLKLRRYMIRQCIDEDKVGFALCYEDGSIAMTNVDRYNNGFSMEGLIPALYWVNGSRKYGPVLDIHSARPDYMTSVWEPCYFFIDKKGSIKIPPDGSCIYSDVRNFSNGLAMVREKYSGKWGYVDKNGKLIIDYKFDDYFLSDFSDGFATVRLNRKWGLIDKTGNTVIPFKYDYISDAARCPYYVKLNDKTFYINRKDQIVQDNKKNKMYAIRDEDGNLTTSYIFEDIETCDNHFQKVKKNDKYGFYLKKGKEIIKPKYDWAGCYFNSLAAVCGQKCGFVDENGKVVIPIKYDGITSFMGETAAVKENNKWLLINKEGEVLKELQTYDTISNLDDEFFVVSKNKKYGLIDTSGNKITALKYDGIPLNGIDFIAVELNGKYGFIRKKDSAEITQIKYDNWSFDGIDFISVEFMGKKGIVDLFGRELYADEDKKK